MSGAFINADRKNRQLAVFLWQIKSLADKTLVNMLAEKAVALSEQAKEM
jgi:hypothetical protein